MLPRSALEESPLADLHVLASELGMDGYRRLRKADLIDAIVTAQGGAPAEDAVVDEDAAPAENGASAEGDDDDEDRAPRRRGRRGGRGRSRDADSGDAEEAVEASADVEADTDTDSDSDRDDEPAAKPRSRRGGAGRNRPRDAEAGGGAATSDEERSADGVVELLGNGSGFLRVNPPDPSDDDVYVSAAQVRRCELVSGDKVSGPVRAPRRSERYPSLVRVDTINGKPADEVAEGTHFDDLPATFPSERFALGGDDPTLKAVEWLTPIGRGSRVVLVGEARAGKSEALRRLAVALKGQEGIDQTVVLAGVRPEELSLWSGDGVEVAAGLSLAASSDAQGQAVERAIETARRVASRGGHAVVLVDTLDHLPAAAARRALAAARNIVDGGSLTVIATATAPLGGETTVIAFARDLTATGRFPALDLVASGTLRPELLVGQAGADAIAQARSAALG
ncbi:MAG: transcription termination factor Rho [Solirubrobacteraceae bacterium]|nr:transcription termination factor Rho [Solirubrobacteraceae bacterium]